jgi:glycosyltransferase involved in cell wall biosynthesis
MPDISMISRMRAQFWHLLDTPARWRYRRQLQGTPLSPHRGGPVLNYGDALTPDGAGLIHGGRVKLLHLAEAFPPSASDFNLLYLVSSAPPQFALELVENQNGVAYPAWYGSRVEEINAPMRELRAQADYIFYQSAFCRDCATRYLGESSIPGEIAFNCVDTAHFSPAEPPDSKVCRLLAAGSHHESYRVMSVLETVAELERRKFPVTLDLAGRLVWKNAEAEVAARIAELEIATLVNRVPPFRQESAPAIYRAAHILLHPKYKDPCPTVPIEAMACGVPVIGSASGGMPELVSNGAGDLLAVPESWEKNYWPDPAAMADAVERIMQSWPQYSSAARANAEAHFSKEQWVAKHRQVFEKLAPA